MSLIQYNDQFFIFQDSLGDGNWLYNSIVNSGALDVMTHVALRKTTTGTIRNIVEGGLEGVDVVKKIYDSYNFAYDVSEQFDTQSKYGEWGTTCDIAFISLVPNVKVVSLGSSNLQVFDSYKYLDMYKTEMDQSAPTVYIYSHMCGSPFVRSVTANHWGTLLEVEKYDYINPTVLDLSMKLISSDSSEAIDLVSDKKIFLTPKKSILSLLKEEKIRQQPKKSVLNFLMSIEDIGMNNTIKFVEEEGNEQHN